MARRAALSAGRRGSRGIRLAGAAGLALFAPAAAMAADLPEKLQDGLPKALGALGVPPEAAAQPGVSLSLLAALGIALVGFGAALMGRRAARVARQTARAREEELSQLEARLHSAESILAAEPDAVFIWTPESLRAAPGTFQSRPRIVGSTATLVDPASGDLDFAYLLSRLAPENAGRLRR